MRIEITTLDNVKLVGQLFKSKFKKAIVIINPGTATPVEFYKSFALFLVENGFDVFVWNYRGFGKSINKPLKNSEYRFSDFGNFDIPAVIDFISLHYNDVPIFCIGHSAGAQQIGFNRAHKKLSGLIAVATSAGYFYNMPFGYRIKALFFFKLFAPVTSFLFNYVPAKNFKFMENLPALMVKEWGNWCSEKELFFSKKFKDLEIQKDNYKDFNFPIHVFVSDDDEISTPKNIESFWKNVKSKKEIVFHNYKALEFPNKSIGHFGYFKKTNKKIWQDILKTLNEFLI